MKNVSLHKTFSPSSKDYFRIIIELVVQLNLDASDGLTFLNGELLKKFYISQPEAFEVMSRIHDMHIVKLLVNGY